MCDCCEKENFNKKDFKVAASKSVEHCIDITIALSGGPKRFTITVEEANYLAERIRKVATKMGY